MVYQTKHTFRQKNITRDKAARFIMAVKSSRYSDYKHTQVKTAPNKAKPDRTEGKNKTVTVWDLKILFSLIGRTTRQKIIKDMELWILGQVSINFKRLKSYKVYSLRSCSMAKKKKKNHCFPPKVRNKARMSSIQQRV